MAVSSAFGSPIGRLPVAGGMKRGRGTGRADPARGVGATVGRHGGEYGPLAASRTTVYRRSSPRVSPRWTRRRDGVADRVVDTCGARAPHAKDTPWAVRVVMA